MNFTLLNLASEKVLIQHNNMNEAKIFECAKLLEVEENQPFVGGDVPSYGGGKNLACGSVYLALSRQIRMPRFSSLLHDHRDRPVQLEGVC